MWMMIMILSACSTLKPNPESERRAIEEVIQADAELGKIRNHAPEVMPIHLAIENYASSLRDLDFSNCPADFETAFVMHIEAWESSVDYFMEFTELRGEMHQLFEEIRAMNIVNKNRLEAVEKPIWDTWADVETSLHRHGLSGD